VADIKAMVLGAKPREDTMQVCLDTDLQAELKRLGEQLGEAKALDEQSFSGGNAQRLLNEMTRLRARAAEHSITLHMRALRWSEAMRLESEHPPRDGDKEDRMLGHNRETYYPALVTASTYKVTHADGDEVDAGELDAAWWDALFTSMNYAQFNDVFRAAHLLNRQDSAAPFLMTASSTSQPGDGGSEQPAPGVSAPAGSTAGSPPRSRKSSSGTRKAARASG
jgi:hypothetical protein